MKKGLKIAVWIAGGILLALAFGLIFGYFVMLLWNWLMPEIFGLKAINYWQSTGLVILCRLLLVTHVHGKPRHGHRKHGHNREHYENWWHNEGKQSFEEYVRRLDNNG